MSDEGQEQEREELEEEAQADLEVPEEASEQVRGGGGTDAGGYEIDAHKSVGEIT
jgi:hypothetical protein